MLLIHSIGAKEVDEDATLITLQNAFTEDLPTNMPNLRIAPTSPRTIGKRAPISVSTSTKATTNALVYPSEMLPTHTDSSSSRTTTSVSAGERVNTSVSASRVSIAGRRRKKNSSWIREGRWKRGDNIGKGSFGEVYKAMNDKGHLFAVKQLNMAGKENEVEDLVREIEMMKELEHPNVSNSCDTVY